ncbi:sigma 54-interacting transcriptional regulator, partial [Escherichia coli]|uniref:sigma 54-interacting transcriptional regulator n=1 Tax=Escherichia coli TaxID=562 RepID=UPI0026E3814E
MVHRLSGRATDRFIALNCAALPKDLAESILFGHKRGAFSGAVNDQLGKFELADGGTLFLDALGELPQESQAKLLRVIEDGIVEPIGVKKGRRVNVRIVAATNVDLRKAVKQKKFRDDLYFRLNVGQVILPPLRARVSDIPKLALSILGRLNETIRQPKRLSISALKALERHP